MSRTGGKGGSKAKGGHGVSAAALLLAVAALMIAVAWRAVPALLKAFPFPPPATAPASSPAPSPSPATTPCADQSQDCEGWALRGECVRNTDFMAASCRRSCGFCGERADRPCDRASGPAFQPGDLKRTFQRALGEFPEYSPKALSTNPYVVQFDNFVTAAEAKAIIDVCETEFQRSLAGDQVSDVRTSTQCWCNFGKCLRDPVVKALEERVANITNAPVRNSEFMQVVRYEQGQFCARRPVSTQAKAWPHLPLARVAALLPRCGRPRAP